MKKIVRLTESDLTRLVKRVIKEQKDGQYMELSPGQTYQFQFITIKGNLIVPDLKSGKMLDMKILSFGNGVLVGQVGQNKLTFNENFLQTTEKTPKQRYFCSKTNPNKCIVDSQYGLTKSSQRTMGQELNDFLGQDSSGLFARIDENNFNSLVLKSNVPFIVDFSAVWCGPCRKTAEYLKEIKFEYGDKFNMGRIDVDVEKSFSKTFNVPSIPVVMIFKNGEMVKRIDKLVSKEEYKTEIDKFL
jgi:thioredoxin 1